MRQLLARMMLGGCFLSPCLVALYICLFIFKKDKRNGAERKKMRSCRSVYMSFHFQERRAERGGKKEDAVTDKLCVLFFFFSTPILSLSLTYAIEHCNQREGDGKTKTRTLPAIRRALLPVSRYYEDEYKKRKENEWSH